MKSMLQLTLLCLILRGVFACQHLSTSPTAAEVLPVEKVDSCNNKNIRYNKTIDNIMTKHCKECHSGNGALKGINLENYQSTRAWFQLDSLRLLRAIRFEGGIYMPPVGQMPDCQIRQIEAWIRNGLPE